MHIGSQIEDMAPFDNAYALMAELVRDLRAQGHTIHHVDVGGGLGIPYHADADAPPLPVEYAKIVRKHLGALGVELVLEPGRLIVGNAGILVTTVEYVKEGDKLFDLFTRTRTIRRSIIEAGQDVAVPNFGRDVAEHKQD